MDLNEAVLAFAGEWKQLTKKEHGTIEGRVLSFETRPATYEGRPSLSRKTNQQRTEWVFVVQPDAGGDPIKFSLMESGQRTVAAAIKQSGQAAKIGDHIKIAVTKDSIQGSEQADYQCRWTPVAEPLNMPATSDEDPF